jgi:magnesium transporter
MIRQFCWDASAKSATCPVALPAAATAVTGTEYLWIDLENPTQEEEEKIFGHFLPVHPLTWEDVTRPRRLPDQGAHLPKVEEFPEYLFAIVNPLPWEVCDPTRTGARGELPTAGDGPTAKRRAVCKWTRPQLSAILTGNVLVTHHYDELPCVDAVRDYVDRRGETTGRGPDYLFHLILDRMVDEYAPVVERFAGRLDRLETQMFRKASPKVLSYLLRLKRQVVFLRKTLTLEREVLARLVRGEFDLVSRDEIAYYRNVYDHLVRYTELIEGAREMVSDLMQTHLSASSNRLNEVMKVLTMISTVGLICSMIAGVYGMNFENMPELKWEYGYPLALGMMATAALTTVGIFWRKGWV